MTIKAISALLIGVLFLFTCGDSGKSPTTKDFQKRFSVSIPAFFEVFSFDVEASENVGSKVEPVFKARFKATIKLKTDTYELSRQEGNTILIKPVLKEGEKKDIYGIATAQLYAGSWKVQFEFENNPIPLMGQPRDFFTSEQLFVVGSKEESEFQSQLEQKRANEDQKRERAEKEAEVQRQKQMEESRQILMSALLSQRTFFGESRDSRDNRKAYPFKIQFTSFNHTTRKFSGEIEWLTLNSLQKIEGDLFGNKIIFKETEYIKKGDALPDCVHTLFLQKGKTLKGTYYCDVEGAIYQGQTWLDIE